MANSSIIDYDGVIESGDLLSPIDHPNPRHLWVTGTGLQHLSKFLFIFLLFFLLHLFLLFLLLLLLLLLLFLLLLLLLFLLPFFTFYSLSPSPFLLLLFTPSCLLLWRVG